MEEHDLGNQEMEEEEDTFALSSVMVKEQEEEARRVVDALLEERLGEFSLNCIEMLRHNLTSNQHLCPGGLAWAVVRYLERPRPKRNTMNVKNTACASIR